MSKRTCIKPNFKGSRGKPWMDLTKNFVTPPIHELAINLKLYLCRGFLMLGLNSQNLFLSKLRKVILIGSKV
jgi:hypothetical protein